MKAKKTFSGVYPAIISPVDETGRIIESELRSLIRYFSEASVAGVYVCGGTGEGILLPVESRKRIAEIVMDEAKPYGMQVIVHIGASDPDNKKVLVQHAESLGVDALSSIPPIYFSYNRKSICDYYRWIAGLTELPLIIYASVQAGINFTADMVEELAAVPNIKGIKFTGYNFHELLKISEVVPSDFSIINGADESFIFGLLAGADGGIGSTYNIMPDKFQSLYELWSAGMVDEAVSLQREINDVIRFILSYPVIGAVKYILEKKGFNVGGPVFPNDTLSTLQKEELSRKMGF